MTRRSETKYVVVHCSATKPSLDVGRREIREWHIAKGWTDIGYHLVIRRNGLVEAGRHIDDIGAHVAGFNSVSIGVCLVGGVYQDGSEADDDFAGLFTAAQKGALKDALYHLKAMHPSAKFLGHRDLSPDKNMDGKIGKQEWLKTCPGFDVTQFCRSIGL